MRTNFPSSLSSYRHSISLFLVLHANVNVLSRPTPCNLSPYTFAPFGPPLPYIHSSIFLFPLFLPHIFRRLILSPSQPHFYSFPRTKTLHQKQILFFFFTFFAFKHATHATQPSIICVDYLCIYSPRWYLSRTHKQKKGIRVLFRKWKKRALRYNRRYQKLKITQILFFFFSNSSKQITNQSTIIQNKIKKARFTKSRRREF